MMRSFRKSDANFQACNLPRQLLLEVNQRLLMEKVELLEEIGQLRAAVRIYRELAARAGGERRAQPERLSAC
jgi:hypothetical protein